jgi:hypothetical protein
MDVLVSVEVGVGVERRWAEHNFAHKPLMKVPGEWDFKAALDPSAGITEARVTVTVELATSSSGEGSALSATADDTADTRLPRPPSLRLPLLCAPERTPEATPEGTPRFPFASRAPAPIDGLGDTSVLFSFAVRRADGVKLGLEIARDEDERTLLVVSVRPDGAIDAWNRQCAAGPSGWKAVAPGDKIVGVNERAGCADMLEEIGEKELLRLQVLRGTRSREADCVWSGESEQDSILADHIASLVECPSTPTADSVDWVGGLGFFPPVPSLCAWQGAWQ